MSLGSRIAEHADRFLAESRDKHHLSSHETIIKALIQDGTGNAAAAVKVELKNERANIEEGSALGPEEEFIGFIARSDDVRYPSKYQHEKSFCITFFTHRDTKEKRLIKGWLPTVQPWFLYTLVIQKLYKNGDKDWWIKRAYSSPPFFKESLLLKFCKQTTFRAMDVQEKVDRKKLGNAIRKEVVKSMISKPDTKWLLSLSFGDKALGQCVLRGEGSQKVEGFLIYPLINSAYKANSLFVGNRFWNELPEKMRNLWEQQLKTPDSAYKMCFRSSMPQKLRYQSTTAIDEMMGDEFLLDEQIMAKSKKNQKQSGPTKRKGDDLQLPIAKKSHSLGGDNVVDEEKKGVGDNINKENELRHALLQIMRQVNCFLSIQQQQHDNARRVHGKLQFVPEMDYHGFKALATQRNWQPCALIMDDNFPDIGPDKPIAVSVPDLEDMLLSIRAYAWFRDALLESRDCCLDLSHNVILEADIRRGLMYLIKQKIVSKVGSSLHFGHDLWVEAKEFMTQLMVEFFNNRKSVKMPLVVKPKMSDGLNGDQIDFLEMVQQHPISIVTGGAGTGKSSLVRLLDKYFPRKMHCMAFTGRAVAQVSKGFVNSTYSTIDMFLARPDMYNKEYDITVLDEFSMCTETKFATLLAKLKTKRLVLVGDDKQLQGFDGFPGGVLLELSPYLPRLHLTKVYRQDPTNLILLNATKIATRDSALKWDATSFRLRSHDSGLQEILTKRAATQFNDFFFVCMRNEDVRHINYLAACTLDPSCNGTDQQKVLNTFRPGYHIMTNSKAKRVLKDKLDAWWNRDYYLQSSQAKSKTRQLCVNGHVDQIVGLLHVKDEVGLNKFYVKEMGKNSKCKIADLKIPSHLAEPLSFITRTKCNGVKPENDKLTAEDYKLHCEQQDSMYVVQLASGRWLRLSDDFSLGWASTINKRQGSEADHVAFYLPATNSSQFLRKCATWRLFYTAVTRSKESFTLLAEDKDDITHMINNDGCITCKLGSIAGEKLKGCWDVSDK